MSRYVYVQRDREGKRTEETVGEETARQLLAHHSRNIEEALRIVQENPNGMLACIGGYLRYEA